MQRRLAVHPEIVRHFALGIALTGLMLTFLAATLLVFPYKVAANPEVQGELLYDLLGHLEYGTDGRFGRIDSPVMQQKLESLVTENRLNGREGSAYILNLGTGETVWSASATPHQFDAIDVGNVYTMQFTQAESHQLAVQNFWLSHNNVRLEFRMVVALPVN
jgi:hypothetical protein